MVSNTQEAVARAGVMQHRLSRKRALRRGLIVGLVGLSIVGFIEFGRQGVWIGLGPYMVLVAVDVVRSSSGLGRVKQRLENAQPCACMFTGAPGTADQVTGLWNGCRIQVGSTSEGARIGVPLARLPANLVVERRGTACAMEHHARTGDEPFDQAVCVGSDSGLWRGVLTAEPRRLLLALCHRARTSLHDRALDVQLADADATELEAVLDLAVAFAAALPASPGDEPLARAFALAAAEPIGAVRAGHYRWLAEQGWNTPLVHRAAAADPDPAIAAWGASQLAPSDGVFR